MLRDHPIVETAFDDPSPEVARVVAIQVHGSSALKKARLPAFGKVQVLGRNSQKSEEARPDGRTLSLLVAGVRNRFYLLFVAPGIPKLA